MNGIAKVNDVMKRDEAAKVGGPQGEKMEELNATRGANEREINTVQPSSRTYGSSNQEPYLNLNK